MYLWFKGGRLNIPKLPIKMNVGGTPNEEAQKVVLEQALKIPMPPNITEFEAAATPENQISKFPELVPGTQRKATQWYIVDRTYQYELLNGNTLYLDCLRDSPDYVFNMEEFLIVKPDSDLTKSESFLHPSTSPYSKSQGNYNIWRKFIYMFLDSQNWLFISYMTTTTGTSIMGNYAIKPNSTFWNLLFKENSPKPVFEDDVTDTGGGDGEFKFVSEEVPIPNLPTKSAVDAGFVTLYNPSNEQLKSLAEYLWTSDFTTAVKKLFNDPMDAILNLSFVPVKPDIAGLKDVSVGFIKTGVTMNYVLNQYVKFDCGMVDVKEQWGSCLDYSPFTKVSIYLPYIGEKTINVDDIMDTKIHVVYNIDLLTGSCVAFLSTAPTGQPERVLYTFSGMCSTAIPVHGRDFTQLLTAGINLAVAGATTAITGGMGASEVSNLIIDTASNVTTAKPQIQKTSTIASSTGLLSIQRPYLIFSYPDQSLPSDYKVYQGYPSNITETLGSLEGYTVIEQVHLENIPATEPEKNEIENMLKGGVIL